MQLFLIILASLVGALLLFTAGLYFLFRWATRTKTDEQLELMLADLLDKENDGAETALDDPVTAEYARQRELMRASIEPYRL